MRPKHDAPPPAKQPETASLPQPPAPARADPPPAEKIDPKRLVGLSRDQVAALIGPPASISDTPPATTWVYHADGCSLDVMFYMDLGSQTFRALAYEVHTAAPGGPHGSDCLGRIRATRNAR